VNQIRRMSTWVAPKGASAVAGCIRIREALMILVRFWNSPEREANPLAELLNP